MKLNTFILLDFHYFKVRGQFTLLKYCLQSTLWNYSPNGLLCKLYIGLLAYKLALIKNYIRNLVNGTSHSAHNFTGARARTPAPTQI